MVNKPPVDPATAAPTVPPATALTVMTSLVSTSLSAPLPLSDITLPFKMVTSSLIRPTSSCAIGPSFTPVTVTVTFAVNMPPLPSVTL